MTNKTLARLETQKTKANTPFMTWWPLFNAELIRSGLPEAGLRLARDSYDVGHSPETAVAEEVAIRSED